MTTANPTPQLDFMLLFHSTLLVYYYRPPTVLIAFYANCIAGRFDKQTKSTNPNFKFVYKIKLHEHILLLINGVRERER